MGGHGDLEGRTGLKEGEEGFKRHTALTCSLIFLYPRGPRSAGEECDIHYEPAVLSDTFALSRLFRLQLAL